MSLLTDDEHLVVDLLGRAASIFAASVVGRHEVALKDVDEFVAFIHGAQRMVLAQAAAREYPMRYRLLGGSL